MPGAEEVFEVCVVLRPRVNAPNDQGDRGPGRDALEDAREHLDLVGLLPLRRHGALSRPPPVEIALDRLRIERNPRRTAVEDHADGGTMALAERGDREDFAEAAAHRDRFAAESDAPARRPPSFDPRAITLGAIRNECSRHARWRRAIRSRFQ